MRQEKPAMGGLDYQIFYDAFNASPIGIALEDIEGRPLYVNSALCSMLGFSEEEMRAKHCVEFSPPEDAAKDWALFQQLKAGAIERYSLEKRFFRKDGALTWGRLSISMLNGRASPLVVAMVEDITPVRESEERRKRAEEAISSLSGRLIEAQEDERRHIARELHDDISQKLAMFSLELQQLGGLLKGFPPTLRDRLDSLMKRTRDLTGDVHALSHRLHSSKLETLGLVATMQGFCRELAEQRDVQIDFMHRGVPDTVPQPISLCLFRVLQEGLGNAVKHSGVSQFEALLEAVSGELQLTIRDRGTGFDPAMAYNDGIGLMSMRERVTLLKGSMSITSKPQDGTEIRVRIPIPSGQVG
jgi:PAS domain S-box-containing protein